MKSDALPVSHRYSQSMPTLEQLDTIVKISAIAGGAIVAYYKFVKGRVHKLRLELRVSGSVHCQDGVSYLLITASVKNIGLSKFDISHEDSGLRVTSFKPSTNMTVAQKIDSDDWRFQMLSDKFRQDLLIEAGETIEEQHLVAIPGCEKEHFAFQVVMRMVSNDSYWEANRIINWEAKERPKLDTTLKEIKQ